MTARELYHRATNALFLRRVACSACCSVTFRYRGSPWRTCRHCGARP